MVILKKIRAATLVETMIASVIIVIVFLIASLSLNNVFKTAVNSNDSELHNRVSEVTYFIKNEKIAVPFYEENEKWDIEVEKKEGQLILSYLNKKNSNEKRVVLTDETP